MALGDKLREAREEKGLKQNYVAGLLGITNQALSNWERGERDPDTPTLHRLAEIYNVSTDWLLGRIDAYSEFMEAITPCGPTVKIPVLGTIRCGDPKLADQEILGWEQVPAHEVQDGDYFYLDVAGDSMTGSRIYPGDRVLIRKQPTVDNGQIAVVLVNGENATLKRVKRVEEAIILYPDNPKYEPQIYKAQDVMILGLVRKVEFRP